ncbi:MAG: hypothetical protein QFX33_01240 [Candidatus Nezhaarchaeota archaeon]|nr:hypothetical protein [Candidatus Nezhaarchaeota archaeon]
MEILGLVGRRKKVNKEDLYRKLIYGKGTIYGVDRDVLTSSLMNLAAEISATPFGLACKALSSTAKKDIGSIVVLSEVKPLARALKELFILGGLAAEDILDLPYAKELFTSKKTKKSVVYGHIRATVECFLLSSALRGAIRELEKVIEATVMFQPVLVRTVEKVGKEGLSVWDAAWSALTSIKPLIELQNLHLMISALPYAAQQAKLTAAYMNMKRKLPIDLDMLLAQSTIRIK